MAASMKIIFLYLAILANSLISNGLLQSEVEDRRSIRDGFRLILSDIDEKKVKEEVDDFTQYKCEKMVIIRNKAEAEFKLTCKVGISNKSEITIQPGKAFVFSFRPLKNGTTKAFCVLEYKQHITRFDVYNEDSPYMCPREVDELYQYTVTHEGIFVDGKAGSEGYKIRALAKGHYKFVLWEEFEDDTPDGYLMGALIDGGMCDDIPDQFNDKTAAVTVCYNHCVYLYENAGCSGHRQTIQAYDDCVNVPLDAKLLGKLSAVKGC